MFITAFISAATCPYYSNGYIQLILNKITAFSTDHKIPNFVAISSIVTKMKQVKARYGFPSFLRAFIF